MKFNVNHPTFVSFLDTVNSNVLSNIKIEGYFTITSDKKFAIQYMALKLIKTAVKDRAKLTPNELKSFTSLLLTKNEESENYEFAAILNDIVKNFDAVNEFVKPSRRSKIIRTDIKQNEE
jgi:hypothetical protein